MTRRDALDYALFVLALAISACLFGYTLWAGVVQAQPSPPPTVRYLPAPDGRGLVIAVESQAPEVSVLQRRGDREWRCEDGFVEYWYPGDRFFVLEVWRDSTGVEQQRRTEISAPHFELWMPIMAMGP